MIQKALRPGELVLMLLAAQAGLAWGVISLWIGRSWIFNNSRGVAQDLLTLAALPWYFTARLGERLGLPATYHFGLVVVVGILVGLAPMAAYIAARRTRRGY